MKHPVTTRERLQARLEKVSSWVDLADGEIQSHRIAISAIKSVLSMVKMGLKQPLSKANMEQLLAGLHVIGIKQHGLPSEEDPRHPESPEWLRHGKEDDLSDVVEPEEFVGALKMVRETLMSRTDSIITDINIVMKNRREDSGFRKKLRNLLRDRHAGAKAAFERMAVKGEPNPRWIFSGMSK